MPNAAALLRTFANIPSRTRLAIMLGVLLLILAVFVGTALMHDNRAALFGTALHADQLAEVEQQLAEWNVAFTPGADNVLVEAKRRNELLLRLSLAGIPHTHVETSNEVLGKIGALTPQSIVDAQARSGLSADLELALRGINGVQDATVIIAPAKPAVFADDQAHDASASVRLHVQPGVHLAPSAVAGIRAFVSAGVPGLEPSRVTILDDRGVALGDQGTPAVDAGELQGSLQSELDSAFGAGSTIVRVHVEYDGRSQQVKEVRRAAGSTVPISSDETDEQYAGSDKHYRKSTRTDDRGSDLREVNTSIASGRVARVSVAVAVDAKRAADLYKIRALATAAAGLDARRGDTIDVQAVHFEQPPVSNRDGWWVAYGAVLGILPTVIICIAVLAGLLIFGKPAGTIVRGIAARTAVAQAQRAVAGFAPTQVRGALRNEPPHTAAAVISALPAATAAAVLDMYPAHERAAIIARMSRPHSTLVPDFESVIANA